MLDVYSFSCTRCQRLLVEMGTLCLGLQYLNEHNGRLTNMNADGLETVLTLIMPGALKLIFNKTADLFLSL